MKVGIVGAGHIASIHGPIILQQDNIELVGIADPNATNAQITANNLGGCKWYTDAKEMILSEKIDVVHVLSPPQFHASISLLAIEMGCHVLVEKPMALNVDDARKMLEAAVNKNVKLCVNHNMVYENVVQRAMGLAARGEAGEIISVEANYQFDPRRYPAILEDGAEHCHWTFSMNGGPLQDLIPHPASLIFEILGDIDEIYHVGFNRNVLPHPWQDEIRVLIKSGKKTGYISISMAEKPDIIQLTLKGTEGIIQADLFSDVVTHRKKSVLPRAADRGLSGFQTARQNFSGAVENIEKFARGKIDKSNGAEPLISQFYCSLEKGQPVPISARKSMRVVELMTAVWPTPTAIKKSTKTAKTLKMRKPKALVTGASGFIGIHLVRKLLREGVGVRAMVRPNSIHAGRLTDLDVEVFPGELADPIALEKAVQGIETVYHAGSPMSNDWQVFRQDAIGGTKHLIEAALRNEVQRFVQFSSLTVYELLKIKRKLINEDSPHLFKPESMGAYPWAKIMIEEMVLRAHQQRGLAATIVRPGMVIGPMGRTFFPHLGYNLQERVFLLIGSANFILPLTFVENTVDGVYLAGISDKSIGKAYNLVDDAKITPRQYIEAYSNISTKPVEIVHLPYIVPYSATMAYEFAALFGVVKKGATSRRQLRWKQARVQFDNQKAKTELGWQPAIPMKESLQRTFSWHINKFG